jgi:divalent metal cation (Fe/Co/Zn/Cd) transporter
VSRIKKIVKGLYPGGVESHHFHIHSYGVHKELTFHIRVNKKMPVLDAHKIATNIEKAILDELKIETTIHIEPAEVEHE